MVKYPCVDDSLKLNSLQIMITNIQKKYKTFQPSTILANT